MIKPASDRVSLARRLKSKWTGPAVGAVLCVAIGVSLLIVKGGEKLIFASYDLPFIFARTFIRGVK